MLLTLKSFRKQFQITLLSGNAGKLLRLSTYHCQLFIYLNVLKFELQHEWTVPQVFSSGCRVLHLSCHDVEEAHDSSMELKCC